MHCKEAVFLSSMDSASLIVPGYGLRIETNQEEYKPAIAFYPGPYIQPVYTLSISRKLKRGKYAEPHLTEKYYDIDKLVATLEIWKIDTEGWEPDEAEEIAQEKLG